MKTILSWIGILALAVILGRLSAQFTMRSGAQNNSQAATAPNASVRRVPQSTSYSAPTGPVTNANPPASQGTITTTVASTTDPYSLGLAKVQTGDYQGAIADLNQAIQTNPTADAYYNRGVAYTQLGRHQEAIADFTQAIQLNPGFAEAYYSRGVARGKLGDQQGAVVDYRQAADLYQQQGRTTEYAQAISAINNYQALEILW